MLDKKSRQIIENAKALGWILEPDAKQIMKLQGLDIPEFVLTQDMDTAQQFLKQIKGPVVAKAISKKILHKTEFHAVATHIQTPDQLKVQMERLQQLDGCQAILVEQMIQGIEVLVGAKNDIQFGPVVVLGIGGTSVEIYNDTAIRMAPIKSDDVMSMVQSLKAKQLITGYRGSSGVNMEKLTHLIITFSKLIMEFEDQMDSVDLNPVICTQDRCVIADARIILQ
ncbi:MAG: acetate--CoA ligase family protein [Pseudomonadota bacterium]